jgi:hypothetical protein|tara:strand:+ start:215 stop:400 length:186 start_codon:yes stop_codon:yes gene_type:complete
MGAVKHALQEVEDFVAGCLGEGRTLNQTIRDAKEAFDKMDNAYLLNADLIEDKYYQFRGKQ